MEVLTEISEVYGVGFWSLKFLNKSLLIVTV